MYSKDLANKVKWLKNEHGLSMSEAFKLADMVERENQTNRIMAEISKIYYWLETISTNIH
ncbi:MAG: hypothetical protein KZQ83_17425 [gamma proteobacterium symbiont of Taylorina sp.]|nr:hypothetical protein [gamma proteobacterium symbiont of Taylorina sp.]